MGCVSSKQARHEFRWRRSSRSSRATMSARHDEEIMMKLAHDPLAKPVVIGRTRPAVESEVIKLLPPEPAVSSMPDKHRHHVMGWTDDREIPVFAGIVNSRVRAFQEKIDAGRCDDESKSKHLPATVLGRGKVLFYFTSLRAVRATYDDCREVSGVLRSYGVHVEERDVSMHGGFKDELEEMLGKGKGSGAPGLPQVFANGRYIGGANDVKRLQDAGKLKQVLESHGVTAASEGREEMEGEACYRCGSLRFLPCEECSGSGKVQDL